MLTLDDFAFENPRVPRAVFPLLSAAEGCFFIQRIQHVHRFKPGAESKGLSRKRLREIFRDLHHRLEVARDL